MPSLRSVLLIAALFTVASPLLAGPPWIAIEYPVNPYDPTTRDAVLLVHSFHHGTPTAFPVSGTAEGLVGNARKAMPLTLQRTSRAGVYALSNQWGPSGEWTLVLTVEQGRDDVAQALVRVSGTRVLDVEVPMREVRDGSRTLRIPRRATPAEIEASLQSRFAGGR